MIAWHVAGAVFLFRWIFRDPTVDVRFLVAGAILPDLVDMSIGTVVAADRFSTGELWLHTLLAPTVLVIGVLVFTRRGPRRRAVMALAVGMFFHLLLDGMWTSTEVFLWPLFGTGFPDGPRPYWDGIFDRASSDPWRWLQEAVGVAYLIGLWRTSGLSRPEVRRALARNGRLAPIEGESLP